MYGKTIICVCISLDLLTYLGGVVFRFEPEVGDFFLYSGVLIMHLKAMDVTQEVAKPTIRKQWETVFRNI